MKDCLILLAAVLYGVPVAAAPFYTITNIGGVGDSLSEAFFINAFGAAVGTAYDPFGTSHGFSYESYAESFGGRSDARGINSHGIVVGSRAGFATVWRNGNPEGVGTLGGSGSTGAAINDLGQVTGSSLTLQDRRHAFLASGGLLIDLGTLGGAWSTGNAVNDKGQVAGSAQTRRGDVHAFRWDARFGMRDLGTLGGVESRAMSMNSSGVVVGAATNRSRYFHAALWGADGIVRDLGTLGGGHSYAYGVNDSGVVVGTSYDAEGRSRAFVWMDGTLLDLNDLVEDLSGWSLTHAYGVNGSGQIVGAGLWNGQTAAFRLEPSTMKLASDEIDAQLAVPEPSGWFMLATGALALYICGKLKLTATY